MVQLKNKLGAAAWRVAFDRACLLLIAAWVLALVVVSARWPLPGDAALMHYVGFLMRSGYQPYGQIRDINLPGAYVADWLLGSDPMRAAGLWRIYDFVLLTLTFAGARTIMGERRLLAAAWCAGLFAVVHLRDGVEQAGQRDLTAGTLLVLGVACLIVAARRNARAWCLPFGFFVGMAALIKPTLLPFLLLVADAERLKRLLVGFAGVLMPLLVCIGWLHAKGAVSAFGDVMRTLAPFHASLGHAGWRGMLHAAASPIVPLMAAWVGVRILRRGARDPTSTETRILWLAVALGFVSFALQQKGYPYQRYPFLIFALVVMVRDLCDQWGRRTVGGWVALAAFAWSFAVFAPVSVYKVARYGSVQREFVAPLEGDLSRILDGRTTELRGRVQCLDTISGCVATLYAMQLPQSTGEIYDEFLFQPGDAFAVAAERAMFLRKIEAAPPQVFVVSEPLFPSGPDDFAKLAAWGDFDAWLEERYRLVVERHPSHAVQGVGRPVLADGYRVYVLR